MDEQELKKIRRWGKAKVIALLVLAILLTVTLVRNRNRLTVSHFTRAIQYSRLGTSSLAEEFRFANLGSNTFDLLGDGIAVASVGGLRVYNRRGDLVYSEAMELASPMIQTSGNFVLAYDFGGTNLQTGDRREALVHMDTEGRLIDAQINPNGWFVTSTERVGSLGYARVFRPDGTLAYWMLSNEGYLIAAGLAPNNRTLVLLTTADAGGRVLWYAIDAVEPQGIFIEEDEIFFDFWFTSQSGDIGLISSNMVLFVSADGEIQGEYRFPDRALSAYDVSDGRIALYLASNRTGGGELVIVEPNGSAQHIEVRGTPLDISLSGRYLAAMFFDELIIYRGTSRYARWGETEGMAQVLMRGDGTVFRLSPHRARLLVP